MNTPTSNNSETARPRLHSKAYTSAKSRVHLQPMYTSVWLALIHGLMNPSVDEQAGRPTPPA